MITLIKPTSEYIDSIQQYKDCFNQRNESIDGGTFLINYDNVIDWLNFVTKLEKQTVTPHLVPAIAYILVDTTSKTVIGMADLRFSIENNAYLCEIGGHIGYSIHPDYRKKGYGKQILAEVIEKARLIGFEELLVTCDETNIGSRKIIEANGGEFERFAYEENGNVVRRYWIALNK